MLCPSYAGFIFNCAFLLTDSIADDYRFLAELLKQQNRNQEAQAVLNLL